MMGISPQELIILLLAALVILGPKKIPKIAKTLAQGLRSFRNASNDIKQEVWSASQGVESPIAKIQEEISERTKEFKKSVNPFVEDVSNETESILKEVNKLETNKDLPNAGSPEESDGPVSRG